MISRVKVLSGYAAKLPSLKNREFIFEKGLNVLFSPNGAGKTTLLNIIGMYCGTQGGWSKHPEPVFTKGEYPHCLVRRNGCKADVTWDGTASFLHKTADSDGTPAAFGMNDCFSYMEEVQAIVCKPSQGQLRIAKLSKVLGLLKKPPDLKQVPNVKYNSTWMNCFRGFSKYVSTLPNAGIVTLLMDEPDRSLSIENQVGLWKILPQIAEKHQVIVATHSPFAIMRDCGNVLDMEIGYLERTRKAIREFVKCTDNAE